MPRQAHIERSTKETTVSVRLDLDGSGQYAIETGVGFFDHMLSHVAKHGLFDLEIKATGDAEVDDHHLVEDVGIVLGQAFSEAAGDKRGIVRFGSGLCPLDESLAVVVVDFSGRGHCSYNLNLPAARVGRFDTELAREFFESLAQNARLSLHVYQQAGVNAHHILESAFKSLGRALAEATRIDPRRADVPSTKGTLG
jgi:imidazoleglycerol-phosphate dehydratase